MAVKIVKPALPDEVLVDNRVYTDGPTFSTEMERIFLRVWNFVCHESELEGPGDFRCATIAGQPVVICRNQDGDLRAFYNTCRHRAAQVVTEPCGSAKVFTCMYHLWSYDLDGNLVGLPGIEAYQTSFNPDGMNQEKFGLVPVRIESLHRMVFICFDDETESLADFLGEAGDILAVPFASPEIRVSVERTNVLPANWKMQPENSRDGYHAPLLHKRLRNVSPPRPYTILRNGHAVQQLGLDYEAGLQHGSVDPVLAENPELTREFMAHPLPGAEIETPSYILTLFPDVLIAFRYSTVLIERQTPLGVAETEIEFRSVGLKGDEEHVAAVRDAHWKLYWAEDGGNLPEDWAAWKLQQKGAAGIGPRYSLIARGEEAETGLRGDDNRIRVFWREWRKYMDQTANEPVHAT